MSTRDAELSCFTAIRSAPIHHQVPPALPAPPRRRVPVESPPPSVFPADGTYQTSVDLFDTLDDAQRIRITSRLQALTHRPTISVIMPVYDPPVHLLRSAVDSVRNQIYRNWELCIADDCSTDPQVVHFLDESPPWTNTSRSSDDTRTNRRRPPRNSALAVATSRKWVAPLDHDDLLAEHTLALVALTLSEHEDAGLVYSDEDKLDESGGRSDPFFKPDFDPLLPSRSELCQSPQRDPEGSRRRRVGGYREGFGGSQDSDLILRVLGASRGGASAPTSRTCCTTEPRPVHGRLHLRGLGEALCDRGRSACGDQPRSTNRAVSQGHTS